MSCVMKAGTVGPGSGAAAGLVYSETSHKSGGCESAPVPIDPVRSRLSRMRRAVMTAARLLDDEARSGGMRGRWAMVTLTYAAVDGWCPRHISALTTHLREWMRRRGHRLRGTWVAELQYRGAVHYHVLVWLPRGLTLPKPDKQGWWPHGSTRVEWVRWSGVAYITKYASKGWGGGRLPRGLRLHGCLGLSRSGATERRWWVAPAWVREVWPDWRVDVMRAPGGGWVSRVLGEWVPSPWRVVCVGGGLLAVPSGAVP